MGKLKFEELIVFENDNYIVINKPPFVASLDDRNDEVNLLSLAKNYHPLAQLCHRLDKETSGALAIAKSPEAYRSLSIQFEKREVIKEYHAVAEGIHNFKDLKIEAPIFSSGKGTVRIDHYRGKESTTTIDTIKAFRAHTLLACFPHSGRMHQIRVHLAHQQAPIIGDLVYGGHHFYLSSIKRNYHLKKGTEELPLIKRIALHARYLKFKDMTGNDLSVNVEYPKDFSVLLKQLDKNI
ncbi:RluA family pseudouridine synthase [Fulvivirgaceae bacterium BMA12]|uniref:RluA family pseudouridine synthase n=1 Tax=Agaribacillus aureus TaxID=3051825 RepID=A0ABT8LI44_9BACT|nr:RluA family pseudouridine synthase [Fulvivirgaceae bacterium BMA12]